MEIFNLIVQSKITPNDFYYLYCKKEGLYPGGISLHQSLRFLETEKWIVDKQDKAFPNWILQPKALELIDQVEALFKITGKKVSDILGSNHEENIQKYLELFPKIKLPSGKFARADKRGVELAFKWFFENYEYSWDIVLKAAGTYVDEYERKTPSYLYMKTAKYFICKSESDKTKDSLLSEYCEMIKEGLDENTSEFTDKIV